MGSYKLRSASAEDRPKIMEDFHSKLDNFEKELKLRGTKFLGGNDRPTMVDYMAWPWFERIEALPLVFEDLKDPVPESRFPKLVN